jgi:hypothetical protein
MELGHSTNIEDRVAGLFATEPSDADARAGRRRAHISGAARDGARSLQPALCQPAHVREVAPGCTGKASITDLTGRHRCVLRRLAQHERRLDISEGGDIGPEFSHAWIIESSLQGLW